MAKLTLTITLHMSELLYDVENKTYLAGRSKDSGDNYEGVSYSQASDAEAERNQILRSIGNAYQTLLNEVSEWLNGTKTTSSDTLQPESDIVVTLLMPSNYRSTVIDVISSSMHQFIVNTAIADWYMLTDKEDSADHLTLAATNLNQLKSAINKRLRPSRPVYSTGLGATHNNS